MCCMSFIVSHSYSTWPIGTIFGGLRDNRQYYMRSLTLLIGIKVCDLGVTLKLRQKSTNLGIHGETVLHM